MKTVVIQGVRYKVTDISILIEKEDFLDKGLEAPFKFVTLIEEDGEKKASAFIQGSYGLFCLLWSSINQWYYYYVLKPMV